MVAVESQAGILFTNIHSFGVHTNGQVPFAGLVQGSDGNFYGTTSEEGTNSDYGTVFKISAGGVLTSLYSFTGGNDGAQPIAGLIQASDGNFYGTTYNGGTDSSGTVFKITPAGVLTSLYSFTGGNDGGNPYAGLVQARDGNFYGTTLYNGTNQSGTIFKITASGVLTSLYSFTGGNDGGYPYAGLIQGSDGDLYGTAYSGGIGGRGVVFKFSPGCLLVQCPTNKTVACGTVWSFDQPIATSCCTNQFSTSLGPTNVIVTPLNTMTNGTCPTVTVTQTWSIVDGCGDSNTCSQMVTVTGCCSTNTNCALVINCPSNIVVTSCFNVQEFYNPTASNICCGVNGSVTCSPPSGSIFAVGTTTTVTCTATVSERSKPASRERMKTSHFEERIALRVVQTAQERDERTQRELATLDIDLGSEWLVPPADCAGTGHPPGDSGAAFTIGRFKTGQSAHRL
jgi:uncharacterized repeat protein (TIGR03803 family)